MIEYLEPSPDNWRAVRVLWREMYQKLPEVFDNNAPAAHLSTEPEWRHAASQSRVALVDGAPAGMVCETQSNEYADTVVISHGYVRDEFRGRGISTALRTQVLDAAREAGKRFVTTWHHPGRPVTRISTRLGFSLSGREARGEQEWFVALGSPIRTAAPDAGLWTEIKDLYLRCGQDVKDVTDQSWRDFAGCSRSAWIGDDLVGVICTTVRATGDPLRVDIDVVMVDPAHRSRGVAAALVADAGSEAMKSVPGVPLAYLVADVLPESEIAETLRRWDYVPVEIEGRERMVGRGVARSAEWDQAESIRSA